MAVSTASCFIVSSVVVFLLARDELGRVAQKAVLGCLVFLLLVAVYAFCEISRRLRRCALPAGPQHGRNVAGDRLELHALRARRLVGAKGQRRWLFRADRLGLVHLLALRRRIHLRRSGSLRCLLVRRNGALDRIDVRRAVCRRLVGAPDARLDETLDERGQRRNRGAHLPTGNRRDSVCAVRRDHRNRARVRGRTNLRVRVCGDQLVWLR